MACGLLAGCVPLGIVGATTVILGDRRSSDAQYIDGEIAKTAEEIYKKDAAIADLARIVPSVYNGMVLLTGAVYQQNTSLHAEQLAREIKGVRYIYNEIRVVPTTADATAPGDNDFYLVSKIKTMLVQEGMSAVHTKVTCDAGNAYLMGLLTREEAAAVVDITRRVSGVLRVVPLFEYVRLQSKPSAPAAAGGSVTPTPAYIQ
jgi:osmotically-inducible protein OsmY